MACKILVVEDDPIVLMTVAHTLRDEGFAVIEAETAEAGLHALERETGIAAVFSDIETPGPLNGIALATMAVEKWPAIPVVLTSGHVFPAPDALPTAVRFVGKPYDLNSIIELVIRLTRAA